MTAPHQPPSDSYLSWLKRCCLRKKKLTKTEAKKQVHSNRQKGLAAVYKYHCPHCRQWHTSKTNGNEFK